ncbi:MAG: MgtC/SapB family protein [Deltaproteobacteria bacterium]|nr:MgtC/SapB family protein [Deltaproteobacteria bacterium]
MGPGVFSETFCKLFLATLLGALIGFERETHGQAAGFRTYILVALGCCLIMMTSLHIHDIFKHFDTNSSIRIDPGRIASYALAGMGFMGAGAIIVGKGTVRGLTTAAGMWMIAAVGLAVGSGYFVPAISVTLLSFFCLYVLRQTKTYLRKDNFNGLTLVSDNEEDRLTLIEDVLKKHPFSKFHLASFHHHIIQETITFHFSLVSKGDVHWPTLMQDLSNLPGIREVILEEGIVP